ncbi:MAG: hypothetical protein C0485_17530 [Pirellula sp.]|nr:hypothetical protein [Pirellula sp.]
METIALNYAPLAPDESRAYREAGHAVMARELALPCHRADGAPRHQFATFRDYCREATQRGEPPLAPIRSYIRFLMAGPAAELLRLELHHGLDRRSAGRTRFRRHWLQRRQARPDAAIDWAFSIVMGWFCHGRQRIAAERFEEFWNAAVEAYQYPTLWRAVEQTAAELVRHGAPS